MTQTLFSLGLKPGCLDPTPLYTGLTHCNLCKISAQLITSFPWSGLFEPTAGQCLWIKRHKDRVCTLSSHQEIPPFCCYTHLNKDPLLSVVFVKVCSIQNCGVGAAGKHQNLPSKSISEQFGQMAFWHVGQ